MRPLPSGLADPLHLPFEVPWRLVAILGAIFLFAIGWVLLRNWLNRRRRAPKRALPAPVPTGPSSIFDEIEGIRGRYAESGSFRIACHELSSLLRGYFERSGRRRFSTLTAGEIHRQLGESRISRFFGFLTELQFGRGRPSRNELDDVCDLAIEIVREKGS